MVDSISAGESELEFVRVQIMMNKSILEFIQFGFWIN